MNKFVITVLSSIVFPIWMVAQDGEHNGKETTRVIVEMVTGTLIGAGSGILCAAIDHKVPYIFPLTWLASMCLRNAAVNDCGKALQTKGTAMSWFSFFASWLAYIKAYQALDNPYYTLDLRIVSDILFP